MNIFDKNIGYSLRTSFRAKNLRLTVNLQGELIVTKPWFVSTRQAEKFVQQKSVWIAKKIKAVKEKSLLVGIGVDDYYRLKEQTRVFVTQKVEKFNEFYHFDYRRIFIRNQQTRWGSCSIQKNLNYNFRLVLLPERQADYIIVHELCHLREMNHSPRFWHLVSQTIPDYQEARRELRKI